MTVAPLSRPARQYRQERKAGIFLSRLCGLSSMAVTSACRVTRSCPESCRIVSCSPARTIWFPALFNECHNLYHKGFEITFMQKNIFFSLFSSCWFRPPLPGSLMKISSGALVFIGEQNLDISSGLQGCRIIGWWENGTGHVRHSARNVTIIKSLDDSDIAFRYSIDPGIYSGNTCPVTARTKNPSGLSSPYSDPNFPSGSGTLIKTRIFPEGRSLSPPISRTTWKRTFTRHSRYRYRPDITPLDSFFTVTLTDPWGRESQSLYSGRLRESRYAHYPL